MASSHAPPEGSLEEIEVFINAKLLAENEMEEQKNQEFYVWYRSELFCSCKGRQEQFGIANFARMATLSFIRMCAR